ncbi:TPA: hypothetical protein ACKOMO_001818 [Clostridioides difficile]
MSKYKIEDGTNLIIYQSKKHNINFTLIPTNEDTKIILKKSFKMIEEGIYYVSIEGILSSGEVELGNITATMFGDGKIILRNEDIEMSGKYKVKY